MILRDAYWFVRCWTPTSLFVLGVLMCLSLVGFLGGIGLMYLAMGMWNQPLRCHCSHCRPINHPAQ
jgi:hypothetical protein